MATDRYLWQWIVRALGWPVRRAQQAIVCLTPRLRQYAPIAHEGATMTSPAPLAELAEVERSAEPEPDFDVHVWKVDVHAELNAMEDNFRHDVEYIWGRFYEWLKVDGRTTVDLLAVAA